MTARRAPAALKLPSQRPGNSTSGNTSSGTIGDNNGTEPTGLEKPSLDLVRRLTDQHVVSQLMQHDVLTRAEIASRTGISKPTISESIRRLGEAGTVVPAGSQVGGRGRSGTYYRLSQELGCALALHAGPEGVIADVLDLRGKVLAHADETINLPVSPKQLAGALKRVVSASTEHTPVVRAVSLSFADPVDQRADRIATLPNSPFLVGEFKPYEMLERFGFARNDCNVDNDTNFGALAEHRSGAGQGYDDFAYLWLGAGIGLGLILNGALYRGSTGLAGEIWQTKTVLPLHGPLFLNECFARLGLLHRGSAAIDADAVAAVLDGHGTEASLLQEAILESVAFAVANAVALVNPQVLIVAGPWAEHGDLRGRLEDRLTRSSITAGVVRSQVSGNPFLVGATIDAVERARRAVLEHCL